MATVRVISERARLSPSQGWNSRRAVVLATEKTAVAQLDANTARKFVIAAS